MRAFISREPLSIVAKFVFATCAENIVYSAAFGAQCSERGLRCFCLLF